jgi:hypothetical protein
LPVAKLQEINMKHLGSSFRIMAGLKLDRFQLLEWAEVFIFMTVSGVQLDFSPVVSVCFLIKKVV